MNYLDEYDIITNLDDLNSEEEIKSEWNIYLKKMRSFVNIMIVSGIIYVYFMCKKDSRFQRLKENLLFVNVI